MNTIFNFSESDPHVSAKVKKAYTDFENKCDSMMALLSYYQHQERHLRHVTNQRG